MIAIKGKTHMSINREIVRQSVVWAYYGNQLSNTKKQTTHKCKIWVNLRNCVHCMEVMSHNDV